MRDLSDIRMDIDLVDRQIVKLFEERMKLTEGDRREGEKCKGGVGVEGVKADLKGRNAVKLIVDHAKPGEKERKTAKKADKKGDAAEAPAEEAKTEE